MEIRRRRRRRRDREIIQRPLRCNTITSYKLKLLCLKKFVNPFAIKIDRSRSVTRESLQSSNPNTQLLYISVMKNEQIFSKVIEK